MKRAYLLFVLQVLFSLFQSKSPLGVIVFLSAHGSVLIMLLIPVFLSLYDIQVATQIEQLSLSGKQLEIRSSRVKKKRTWNLK